MGNIFNDKEYIDIVCDILDKDEFNKLDNCRHHGSTRLDHCIRVSYVSYKIAKRLRLNYTATARAGLLHDFFFEDNTNATGRQKQKTMLNHPTYALDNAKKYFYIGDIEEDIILSHMFPVGIKHIPKYIESWLVDIVDDACAIYEFYSIYGKTLMYRIPNLYLILLLFK